MGTRTETGVIVKRSASSASKMARARFLAAGPSRQAIPRCRRGGHPERLPVGAPDKRERILAEILVDEISLPEGAAQQILDRVDRAHVGLHDRHHFLVGGAFADFSQRDLRRTDANGQPGSEMAVKPNDLVDDVIHQKSPI